MTGTHRTRCGTESRSEPAEAALDGDLARNLGKKPGRGGAVGGTTGTARYHRPMDSPARRRLHGRGPRSDSARGTADATSSAATLEPVDHDAFPDTAARRAIDDGKASQRFRDLLDETGPILADGAMGTMLFLSLIHI